MLIGGKILLPLLNRDDILNELNMLFISNLPFVYVTGPPNSGKSYTIDFAVMKMENTKSTVSVDMRDITKVQGLYHTILSQLLCNKIPDHISDFIGLINTIVSEDLTIVIKHAQILNELSSMLFASFTIINQLTNGKVCVIMVSDTPWDLVYHSNGSTLPTPMILNIPPHTRNQIVEIIAQSLQEEHKQLCNELQMDFAELQKYVRTCVYDSLTLYTSSIREMMLVANTLLPKYLEPIRDGSLKKSDNIKLFQRIQQDLVTTMSELSCVPHLNKTSLELPYNMRVLLVCAFLASHNPARLDKRFFCKGKSSRRKSKTRASNLSEVLKGPKTFPLDRLLAIHATVTQNGSIPCSDVMSAISTLVSLNLIARVSVDLLEQPKFKCLAPLTTVKSLAKESNIDFQQFYYNY